MGCCVDMVWLRSALRVMEPLASAEDVYTQRELYNLARDGVDWPAIITEGQTRGVNAVLAASTAFEGSPTPNHLKELLQNNKKYVYSP